jgi:DNA-binding beta-propeller fold protein YncE
VSLTLQGYIDLPAHIRPGDFDHAAILRSRSRLYVAHTANDALDVIDCSADRYLHSLPNLRGVAGALVSEDRNLIFTSNRGEDTVSIFSPDDEKSAVKVGVGIRPNGLAFDAKRGLLLAANVGDPDIAGSFTLSIVDIAINKMIVNIPMPGRTRWSIFDPTKSIFYVNIAKPPLIALVDADHPTEIVRNFEIPAMGPHGLDLDVQDRRLFCACDDRQLITLDADNGQVLNRLPLSGTPDVIFHNASLRHLYVAIGDPGVVDVIDTKDLKQIETLRTEKGAHTIAFDSTRNKIFALLPGTHRAAVYLDN